MKLKYFDFRIYDEKFVREVSYSEFSIVNILKIKCVLIMFINIMKCRLNPHKIIFNEGK